MENHQNHSSHRAPYIRFSIMLLLSFVAMYILMYAMVDTFGNAVPNYNQFYMAGLMTMPMVLFELILMGGMYPNKKLNLILLLGSIFLGLIFWICIRQQLVIGDEQFLKSMIPHHAGAILMCEEASLSDGAVKELCREIVVAQEKEIAEMRALLEQIQN